MYGAQHEFILDDRDVDEYNKNRKFEKFAHLKQDIQKLIVYSTVETVLYIDTYLGYLHVDSSGPSVDHGEEHLNLRCPCCTAL